MRAFLWIVRLLLFLFLFAFALKNSDPVNLRFFFGQGWNAPLVIVLLAFFVGGAAIGVLSLLGTVLRLRRDLAEARRGSAKRPD